MAKDLNSKVIQFLAYREFNRYFLTMLGWSQYYHSYTIYRILPYIHLFLSMSTAYVIFRFVKVHYNNISQLTRGLSFMTSFILISIKMTCLITHKKELFDLHRFLDENIMNLVKKITCHTHVLIEWGTHLTIESEEYINAIYCCNWYGNRQFMLAMVIMLKQRPLILTVCHFSIVSLDIFIKISKTSLSYFFLLKILDN